MPWTPIYSWTPIPNTQNCAIALTTIELSRKWKHHQHLRLANEDFGSRCCPHLHLDIIVGGCPKAKACLTGCCCNYELKGSRRGPVHLGQQAANLLGLYPSCKKTSPAHDKGRADRTPTGVPEANRRHVHQGRLLSLPDAEPSGFDQRFINFICQNADVPCGTLMMFAVSTSCSAKSRRYNKPKVLLIDEGGLAAQQERRATCWTSSRPRQIRASMASSLRNWRFVKHRWRKSILNRLHQI